MVTVQPATWDEGGAIGGPEYYGDDDDDSTTRDYGVGGTREEDQLFGPTPGYEEFGAESQQTPQGRAFFRGGNPGDLIIIQTPEVHGEIETLLSELRRSMYILVNVETRFIEVNADFIKEVGFSWPEINMNYDPDAVDSSPDISIGTGISESGSLFGETAGQGLDAVLRLFHGGTNVQGFLRLVESRRDAKTLATPIVTLMNGQRGYMLVETTQAYISSWETGGDTFEPQVDTIAETMSLDVRPIVSADRRYVYLELIPLRTGSPTLARFEWQTVEGGVTTDDTSAPVVATNFIQLPQQLQETFEVTVAIPDRGFLMVGGMSDYSVDEVERGVPILNKIPIIKRLFMGEGKSVSHGSLLILVKPTIILMDEEEERAF